MQFSVWLTMSFKSYSQSELSHNSNVNGKPSVSFEFYDVEFLPALDISNYIVYNCVSD